MNGARGGVPPFARLTTFLRDRHDAIRAFIRIARTNPTWGKQLPRHRRRRARAHVRYTRPRRKLPSNEPQRFLHRWHAKRMYMEKRWNAILPISRMDRSARALVRRVQQKSVMMDRSFMQIVELTGTNIITALQVFKHSQQIVNVRAGAGNRRAELFIPELGPLQVWWRSNTTLWVWLHPAMNAARVLAELGEKHDVRVRLVKMNQFELVGKQMWDVCARALNVDVCTGPNWGDILAYMRHRPSMVPPGAVLPVTFALPEGQTRSHIIAPPQSMVESGYPHWMKKWPDSRCDDIVMEDVASSAATTLVAQGWLIFGAISTSAMAYLSCDVIIDNPASPAIARTLWNRLVFANALPIGVDDRWHVRTHFALREFPMDYPDTPAGRTWQLDRACDLRAIDNKKPPAKRVPYRNWAIVEPYGVASAARPLLVKIVACSRGVPRDGCHLYQCREDDVRAFHASSARRKMDVPRRMGPALRQVYKRPAPRRLIGAVSSGGHSAVEGRGVGLGGLAWDVWREQEEWGKKAPLLWFRNRSSPHYHLAWAYKNAGHK
eukprot:GEMP01025094.1.p1 GENE.GEMP01025094.1~~GEMP01025094.1.p1  ORF type:complete len:549 (+),score=126.24 GEMP01025094.1:216-1862(+)